jgi:ATP-dependent DNA helicase RecG
VRNDAERLAEPLERVPGIGPVRAGLFARLDLLTVGDLLFAKPRRYEDRRRGERERPWEDGDWRAMRVRPVRLAEKELKGRRTAVEVRAMTDAEPEPAVVLRWYHAAYLVQQWAVLPAQLCVFGRLRRRGREWQIDQPEWEVVHDDDERAVHVDRIVPVYSTTEGLSQRVYRGVVYRLLAREVRADEEWNAHAEGLPAWGAAVRSLHFPPSLSRAELARRRLAFDEFLVWQTLLALRRQRIVRQPAPVIGESRRLVPAMLAASGLVPTRAQARVCGEIGADLARGVPMNRLLQGDVGSGKTLVALVAMLTAVEAGHAAVLMAPTDLLAQQHFRTVQRLTRGLGLTVALRTGSRKQVVGDGYEPDIHLGTHALIEDGAVLPRVGLVVVDEQHKFGVEQRARLRAKAGWPHVLVMTATPIPRTIGLTLHGDLDVSVIDEAPRGRGKVLTAVRPASALPRIWEFVKKKCEAGRQAYVVYPLIEKSETSTLKSVSREIEGLRAALAPLRVEVVHGRLRAEAKRAVMEDFREGRVAVLVSTTVVEVGVDVPNATVMVIENAERFGLAQLHQLRGRVGRGEHASYCVLVADARSELTRRRLRVMEETTDGFRIAEVDLQIRGFGDVLGKMQHGTPPFRLGNLATDLVLIRAAQQVARGIVEADAALKDDANAALRARVRALARGRQMKRVDAA